VNGVAPVSRRLGAQWGWTGRALVRDLVVEIDASGQVLSMEQEAGQPHGLLSPGLINAHTHLELGARTVPGGDGMVPWVAALLRGRGDDDERDAARRGIEALRAAGTVGVVDISNTGASLGPLSESGLSASVMGELIGWSEALWGPALARIGDWPAGERLALQSTPHSLIGCAAALVRAALQSPGRAPVGWSPRRTLHCDESPDDAPLLQSQSGPWADWLRGMGRPFEAVISRAASGVMALDEAGLLDDRLALVHLVTARPADLDRVAARGAMAILCPRSNLYITGLLPPVAAMAERGIGLALGTDSLASNTDLDVLEEARLLARRFSSLPRALWMEALTAGGATVLGDPARGHLRVGARPGLVRFDLPATDDPLRALLLGEPVARECVS
jgi:cytosine/adenosine deaminase-related metal-dependent hydrolase